MLNLEELSTKHPFALSKAEKREYLTKCLTNLVKHHADNCPDYARIVRILNLPSQTPSTIEEFPFIPARLFKELDLKSASEHLISNIITSSGTTGKGVSRIFLDQRTADSQKKVLHRIVSDVIGPERLPMLIVDRKSILKARSEYSARGAGILGFSLLGRKHTFVLNEKMGLDYYQLDKFLEKHSGSKILVFGFTSVIWEHFVESLSKMESKVAIEKGILLHGGGWKKMVDKSVDNLRFKERVNAVCGIKNVHNYYGVIEQTGSILLECEVGNLHCSNYSDVVIRRTDFSVCRQGEEGLMQLISILPSSYPGHSVLTEDLGYVSGEDDCECGRLGKTIKVLGRVKEAELRGCSDTYTL